MTNRFIAFLLIVFLSACCNCPPNNPARPWSTQRHGDAAAIRSQISPFIDMSSAAFIASLQWIETAEINIDILKTGEQMQACYMTLEGVLYKPGSPPETLAHEILHGFWEHNLIPNQDGFMTTVDQLRTSISDDDASIREMLNSLTEVIYRYYPEHMHATEIYAYLGSLMMIQHEFTLPESILRYYRGVLNNEIIKRRETPQAAPSAERTDDSNK